MPNQKIPEDLREKLERLRGELQFYVEEGKRTLKDYPATDPATAMANRGLESQAESFEFMIGKLDEILKEDSLATFTILTSAGYTEVRGELVRTMSASVILRDPEMLSFPDGEWQKLPPHKETGNEQQFHPVTKPKVMTVWEIEGKPEHGGVHLCPDCDAAGVLRTNYPYPPDWKWIKVDEYPFDGSQCDSCCGHFAEADVIREA